MRTERRHELHHNVLADWLGVQIERLRPYSRAALATVLGLLVLGAVGMYLRSQSSARQDEQWLKYYQAMDLVRYQNKPEELIALVDSPDYHQTPAGYWAAEGLGDYYLRLGVSQLFSNRAEAATALKSAVQTYGQVAQQAKYPMLAQRALLEMGSAHEGLNQLDDARKSYNKIISAWPGCSYEPVAKQRIAELDRKSTPGFYDWFFAMSPSPRGGIVGPGVPGSRPSFSDMPKEQTFTSPLGDKLKSFTAPNDSTPSTPASETETPPADATPATEPPSDTAPPAEPPPAGDQPPAEPPAADATPATPPADAPPPAAPPAGKAPKE